jgi:tellurite resistance protein TerC
MPSELVPWLLLASIVGGMLALDLFVLHREPKPVPFGEAARWSAVWITLALGFGAYVWLTRGETAGGEYLAGYLIELSLSVDNVFVFALIFGAFAVPAAYQHRLLFWGILGAIIFRAIFIAAGTAILGAAHWVIYLLGVLLVVTGIRLARSRGHAVDPAKNPVLRLFRRVVPMTEDYRGAAFVVREAGRRLATPLLAVLVVIETTDIMFAIDSIPAVFAVTTDPFIVFSSNLFAILGLRSLYFLLAGLLDRFIYLKVGLAALLVFAGVKILVSEFVKIPIALSLGVIVSILATSILASLIATHPERDAKVAALQARVREPAIHIGLGLLLGIGALALFAAAAAARNADAAWLVADLAIVAAVAGAVAAAIAWLRARNPAAQGAVRGWALAGAATVLMVAAVILLD